MKYFKTALPIDEVKTLIRSLRDDNEDVCLVQIRNKKSIIVTTSETVADQLSENVNFRPIQLSPTDISVIKIVHPIDSIVGNPQLF